jgi:hypothetical protein
MINLFLALKGCLLPRNLLRIFSSMKLDGGSSMMKTIIMMKVILKINRK